MSIAIERGRVLESAPRPHL